MANSQQNPYPAPLAKRLRLGGRMQHRLKNKSLKIKYPADSSHRNPDSPGKYGKK